MAKKTNVGGIVSTLLEGVHELSKSETIIGEPQETGGATVIPVHRLRVTFGAGTTKLGAHGKRVSGDSSSYGAVGAVDLDPVAAVTVGRDGRAQLLTVEADSLSTWSSLIAEVPALVTKVAKLIADRVEPSVSSQLEDRKKAPALTDGEE